MSRIKQAVYEELSDDARIAYQRQVDRNGYITNMKMTLLRSLPAFDALMQWYPLRDSLLQFLDEQSFVVFCYAISTENDCLVCSTFFRKEMADLHISLADFALREEDVLLERFGRAMVAPSQHIDDDLFRQLKQQYSEEQIVLLTAFGAMMMATNVINNVLEVPLDDRLVGYLPGGNTDGNTI